jgi:hypothetical protein
LQIWIEDRKTCTFKKNGASKDDQTCPYGAFEVAKIGILELQKNSGTDS